MSRVHLAPEYNSVISLIIASMVNHRRLNIIQKTGYHNMLDHTILPHFQLPQVWLSSVWQWAIGWMAKYLCLTGTRDLFSAPKQLDHLWGKPSQWVPGALSLGVKQPGHKADLWPVRWRVELYLRQLYLDMGQLFLPNCCYAFSLYTIYYQQYLLLYRWHYACCQK
jgi:hypothetical protein